MRRDYWARAETAGVDDRASGGSGRVRGAIGDADCSNFLTARAALVAAGVPVVDARLARSEEEAVAHLRHFGTRGRRQGRGAGPSAQERSRLRPALLRERARRAGGLSGGRRERAQGRLPTPASAF